MDAYLALVSKRSFLEAVASSLTELFSRDLISVRISKLKTLYPWMRGRSDYFEARLTQAPEDAAMALDYVCTHARTREQQDLAIQALTTKCEILWAQLDAIYYSYVSPGSIPARCVQAGIQMTAAALDESKVPALARGCRLGKDQVLLMPEGILKLSASAVRILELCDGKRSIADIVSTMQSTYAPEVHERIRADVHSYLSSLAQKQAVELR